MTEKFEPVSTESLREIEAIAKKANKSADWMASDDAYAMARELLAARKLRAAANEICKIWDEGGEGMKGAMLAFKETVAEYPDGGGRC